MKYIIEFFLEHDKILGIKFPEDINIFQNKLSGTEFLKQTFQIVYF